MTQKLKAISNLFLIFACLIISPVSKNTKSQKLLQPNNQTFIVNEYDFLKSVSSEAEWDKFESLYLSHLKELNEKYTDKQLSNLKYDAGQIKLLRHFTPTQENLSALSAKCIFESLTDFGGSLFTSVFMDYSFEWAGEPVCFRTGVIGIAWDNDDDFALNDNYDNGLLLKYGNENGDVKNMKISNFSDFDQTDSTEGTYLKFENSSGSGFVNCGKGRLRIDSPKVMSEGEAVQIVLAHGQQNPDGHIILKTDEV